MSWEMDGLVSGYGKLCKWLLEDVNSVLRFLLKAINHRRSILCADGIAEWPPQIILRHPAAREKRHPFPIGKRTI